MDDRSQEVLGLVHSGADQQKESRFYQIKVGHKLQEIVRYRLSKRSKKIARRADLTKEKMSHERQKRTVRKKSFPKRGPKVIGTGRYEGFKTFGPDE